MFKKPLIGILFLAGLSGSTGLLGSDSFPGIKSLMSEKEFLAAGLDRLSQEELEALNHWLVRYTAGEADLLRTDNKAVKEARKDFVIEARISGEFDGWDGNTVFHLDNGQIWRQRLSGRYHYTGPANPQVRISRNWMGFYMLTLQDSNKSIGVRQVRGQ